MSIVKADISISLDGYVTGPDPGPEHPLGRGGEALHQWLYDLSSWRAAHGYEGGGTGGDSDVLAEAIEGTGALIMGNGMFSAAEDAWGAEPPFHAPVFVLAHEPREPVEREGGTTFHFTSDPIEAVLDRAREAAAGGDVSIAGGADAIQQFLAAGSLDELQVHVVPLLLGGGIRLFADTGGPPVALEIDRVLSSPSVTHLRYRRSLPQAT